MSRTTRYKRMSIYLNDSLVEAADLENGNDCYADETALMLFTRAMSEKLSQKRHEGRGGWYFESCKIEDLRSMLKTHIDKGDMVDVANLAMMIAIKESMAHE